MLQININKWPFLSWKSQEVSSQTIGWASLFVSITAASTYNSFAKVLGGTFSGLTLLFLSEALMGTFVVISFGLMPTLKRLIGLPTKMICAMIVVGLLSSTLAPLLFFQGLQSTSAVNASLFSNSEMVFLILLAVFVLREEFTRIHALSISTIAAGMLVITLQGGGIFGLHRGDLLILLSGLTFASGSMIYRTLLHHLEPHVILLVRSTTAVCCFFLVSPFIEHPLIEEIQAMPLALLPVLIAFGFMSRFLNVFTFYEALERLPVTTVSMFSNFAIIASALFAHFYLGEPITIFHMIGGGMILAGGLLLEFVGTHPSEQHLENHLRQRQGHRI